MKIFKVTIKKTALILFSLFFVFQTAGCGGNNKERNNPDKSVYYEFPDYFGKKTTLYSKPKKVVSLMGSYAELWFLAGGDLVGTTEDAISERGLNLSDNIKIIGTVKDPNLELLFDLSPDFILLSSDLESHIKLGEIFKDTGIDYAYFKQDNYADYLSLLKIFTEINDSRELYEKYGASVEKEIKSILDTVSKDREKPKVLLIRSMSVKAKALKEDHMVGIMLKDLNTDNITSRHVSLLEDLSVETVIAEDPDFIFAITMGDEKKAIDTLETAILANPAWQSLSAVKNGRFHILPKDLFQYKPNARWAESYEYLRKILYGENIG